MSEQSQHPAESGPPHRLVEIGVAIFTGTLGLIAIIGSIRVGIKWCVEGPQAGFFPFYVWLFILGGSIINLYNAITAEARGRLFATWEQLHKVTSVVIPTGIYVLLVPMLGIYVPSMLLIGVFM